MDTLKRDFNFWIQGGIMSIEILNLSTFFASWMGNVFSMMDSVYIEDGISYLDVILAIWFFNSTVWFTIKMIARPEINDNSGNNKGKGNSNINENIGSDGAF